MTAIRFVVHGRVQGVGFRYFAKTAAEKLGLSGFTRNLDDGTVEVVAVGPREKVENLRSHLQRGPTLAEVRHIEQDLAPGAKHTGFEIR